MADRRPRSTRGPQRRPAGLPGKSGGARTPGRPTSAGRSRTGETPLVRAGLLGSDTGSTRAVGATASAVRGPRLTGRAAILILLLLVLAMSYLSSTRAYLTQRAHIADLKAEISARSSSIDDLEREKKRWKDDAFLEQQARERFGFVFPGETSYQVIDENGEPLDSDAELPDPTQARLAPTAWWETAWASVEGAGHPPKPGDGLPADVIKDSSGGQS